MYNIHGGAFFMAAKGQKFKKYTSEQISQVLKEYDNGLSYAFLAEKYQISPKTIMNWVHKRRQGKNVLIDSRKTNSGRKSEEANDYKERYEILKKYQAFLEARHEKK